MGIFDSLFGPTTNTSTTTSGPPQQVLNNYQDLVNRAYGNVDALHNLPGPPVAGMTDQQYGGQNLIGSAAHQADPYFQVGYNSLNQGFNNAALGFGDLSIANTMYGQGAGNVSPTQFSGSAVNQYMSPYTQNVIDTTMANINRNNQLQQNQLRGSAILGGNAFGGDRAGVAAAELARNQDLASGQVMANLQNQNYSQALNEFNTQQQTDLSAQQNNMARRLQAASGYGNLAGTAGGLGATQAGIGSQIASLGPAYTNTLLGTGQANMQAGQVGQQTYQNYLNSQYQGMLNQLGLTTPSYLAPYILGTGAQSGGTGTTTSPGPSILSQLGGAALGTIGLVGGTGGFGSNGWLSNLSDERLKENIEPVGKTFDNQPIYRYNFKGDPKTQIGLIAQDVERRNPSAVHEPSGLGGIKMVDYGAATDRSAQRGHFDSGGSVDEDSDFLGSNAVNASSLRRELSAQQSANMRMAALERDLGYAAGGETGDIVDPTGFDSLQSVPLPIRNGLRDLVRPLQMPMRRNTIPRPPNPQQQDGVGDFLKQVKMASPAFRDMKSSDGYYGGTPETNPKLKPIGLPEEAFGGRVDGLGRLYWDGGTVFPDRRHLDDGGDDGDSPDDNPDDNPADNPADNPIDNPADNPADAIAGATQEELDAAMAAANAASNATTNEQPSSELAGFYTDQPSKDEQPVQEQAGPPTTTEAPTETVPETQAPPEELPEVNVTTTGPSAGPTSTGEHGSHHESGLEAISGGPAAGLSGDPDTNPGSEGPGGFSARVDPTTGLANAVGSHFFGDSLNQVGPGTGLEAISQITPRGTEIGLPATRSGTPALSFIDRAGPTFKGLDTKDVAGLSFNDRFSGENPTALSFNDRSGGGNFLDPAAYGQPDAQTGVLAGVGPGKESPAGYTVHDPNQFNSIDALAGPPGQVASHTPASFPGREGGITPSLPNDYYGGPQGGLGSITDDSVGMLRFPGPHGWIRPSIGRGYASGGYADKIDFPVSSFETGTSPNFAAKDDSPWSPGSRQFPSPNGLAGPQSGLSGDIDDSAGMRRFPSPNSWISPSIGAGGFAGIGSGDPTAGARLQMAPINQGGWGSLFGAVPTGMQASPMMTPPPQQFAGSGKPPQQFADSGIRFPSVNNGWISPSIPGGSGAGMNPMMTPPPQQFDDPGSHRFPSANNGWVSPSIPGFSGAGRVYESRGYADEDPTDPDRTFSGEGGGIFSGIGEAYPEHTDEANRLSYQALVDYDRRRIEGNAAPSGYKVHNPNEFNFIDAQAGQSSAGKGNAGADPALGPPIPPAAGNNASADSPEPSRAGLDSPGAPPTMGKVDPWMALATAGFGMMAGRSPHALTNIGQGALAGLGNIGEQREQLRKDLTAAQRSQQLAEQAKQHRDALSRQQAQDTARADYQAKRIQIAENAAKTVKVPFGYQIDEKGNITHTPGGPHDPETIKRVEEAKRAPGEPSLKGGALDTAAQVHLDTGSFPSGMSRDNPTNRADRLAIQERSNELREAKGMKPEDVPSHRQEFKAQQIAIQRFMSGKHGDIIRSLDVTTDHVGTMERLALAAKNGNIPLFNEIAMKWAYHTGKPVPTNIDAAKQIVGTEIIKALGVAGAGTKEEREKIANAFSRDKSPDQILGVTRDVVKPLLIGQLNGLRQQFATSTGLKKEKFDERLLPGTREFFGQREGAKGSEAPESGTQPKVGERKQFKQGVGVWNGTTYVPEGAALPAGGT